MSGDAVKSDAVKIPPAVSGVGGWLDDRFTGAKGVRVLLKKVFPDHWSFMLGEIALWSFVILLLTGTYLALFFNPSAAEVVYHGSYAKLDGITMSQAYSSTLNISFDVRGGLLMRQIHHWAAIMFMVAIMAHLLRVFFTGAYRKPREVNWLIGVVLFTLGLIEGLFGYSLPDDQLSGAGLRITEGVMQGIPIVGTYLAYFFFGGEFPGTAVIPRMYILHVFLVPGIILALITAHLFIMFHQKHTQMPAKGNTERNVVGAPFFPYFLLKGQAWVLLHLRHPDLAVDVPGRSTRCGCTAPTRRWRSPRPRSPTFTWASSRKPLRSVMPAWGSPTSSAIRSRSRCSSRPWCRSASCLPGLALWPFFEQWATEATEPVSITSTTGRGTRRSGRGSASARSQRTTASCGWKAPTTSSPTRSRYRCTRSPGSRGSRSSWCPWVLIS